VDQISVSHTADGLKAFVCVPESMVGNYPSVEELRIALAEKGIVFGVDNDALERMVGGVVYNVNIEAAHGLPPVDGTPGRIDILVDVSSRGKPKALPGGRVDHRDLGYVVNVRKNTQIMRRIPPYPGTDGKSVLGKPIHCNQPPRILLLPGPGTRILEQDTDVLVADRDGAVAVFPNGKAVVLDEKEIPVDIDYATGNISFMGNLRIMGTVRGGFEVEAAGNVWIGGSVEDAKVTAGGDLEIVGGATGVGNCVLKSGGSLKVRHLQNFSVHAIKVEIVEDVVHSTVWAEKTIAAKAIVGGSISVGQILDVDSIGTLAEPRTVIDLGGMNLLLEQKYGLLKDLAAITAEAGTIKGAMFNLVKDEMDAGGMLPPGAVERLDALKQKVVECTEKNVQIQGTIETLDEKLNQKSVPVLQARTIYPNTLIKAGSLEKNIKEMLTHVKISVDQGMITLEKT
jgi:hypothetical protein